MVTLMLHERMLAIDSAGLHLNFDWGNRQLWPKLTLLVESVFMYWDTQNTTQHNRHARTHTISMLYYYVYL